MSRITIPSQTHPLTQLLIIAKGRKLDITVISLSRNINVNISYLIFTHMELLINVKLFAKYFRELRQNSLLLGNCCCCSLQISPEALKHAARALHTSRRNKLQFNGSQLPNLLCACHGHYLTGAELLLLFSLVTWGRKIFYYNLSVCQLFSRMCVAVTRFLT